MSTTTTTSTNAPDGSFSATSERHLSDPMLDLPYRALSRMAIWGFLLGVLSLSALLFPGLLLLPLIAAIFSLIGWANIRRYPEELSGHLLAVSGVLLGLGLLLGGSSLHAYVYLTEVPEGYQRISFKMLQPGDTPDDYPIPKTAKSLDGEQVFVKGYVHPDAGMGPVRRFVLVPDMGTCCFGGQPKLTDMIEVTLDENRKPMRYSTRKQKLAGVLKVDEYLKPVDGLQGVFYQLHADYAK